MSKNRPVKHNDNGAGIGSDDVKRFFFQNYFNNKLFI